MNDDDKIRELPSTLEEAEASILKRTNYSDLEIAELSHKYPDASDKDLRIMKYLGSNKYPN